LLSNYFLVEELAALNLNDSTTDTNQTQPPPPPSNTFDAFDFFQATGVCPSTSSSRKSSTAKRPKRLNK